MLLDLIQKCVRQDIELELIYNYKAYFIWNVIAEFI